MATINAAEWAKTTKQIFTGVLVWQIGSVVYAILKPFLNIVNTVSSITSFLDGGSGGSSVGIFETIIELVIIGGYVLFLLGVMGFTKILDGDDAKAMGNVRLGIFLGVAATVCSIIDIPIVPTILNIIGFIFMFIGYSALNGSATFPANARKGAGRLKIAMIFQIIGFVLGFIPLAGGFLQLICSVVSFFMVLSGWACIKNSTPETA